MTAQFIPPSLTPTDFRAAQLRRWTNARTLDTRSSVDYPFLHDAECRESRGVLLPPALPFTPNRVLATRFRGASASGEMLAPTVTTAGYPENFLILETTYDRRTIGNNFGYFRDDGSSFRLPPSQWVTAFFATGLAAVYQGARDAEVYDPVTDIWAFETILTPAHNMRVRTPIILPVSLDAPTTPIYSPVETNITRPQFFKELSQDISTQFFCYLVTGYTEVGGWAFGPQQFYLRDTYRDFYWVPTLSTDESDVIIGDTIVDGTPLPECRANHPIQLLGWDFSFDSGTGGTHYAGVMIVCWGDLLAITAPTTLAPFDPGVTIPFQWKPAPDWAILSRDDDPDAPQLDIDGFIMGEETDDTGWTTFATMDTYASGPNAGGIDQDTVVTIAGTQPARGQLVAIRIGYEVTGAFFEDIESATREQDPPIFHWGPTYLPFAVRTTDGLLPGHTL